ncbi:MAG: hypothetical protein IT313_03510 [Anaerolineales bacterium]|nr:hypothetical protein [Anaerolineales bacterium]
MELVLMSDEFLFSSIFRQEERNDRKVIFNTVTGIASSDFVLLAMT